MKKIAKEVWDFICMTALIWWVGVSLTVGVITAADHLGVVVAVAYEDAEK